MLIKCPCVAEIFFIFIFLFQHSSVVARLYDPPVTLNSALSSDQQAGLIGENPLAALPVQQGVHLLGDLPQGLASTDSSRGFSTHKLHVFAFLTRLNSCSPVCLLIVFSLMYSDYILFMMLINIDMIRLELRLKIDK